VNLFDASALLVFLQDEPGATIVEAHLNVGGAVSAVNWSEVAQKVLASEGNWPLARALLLSYDIAIEPVTGHDAERAAELWRRGDGRSLADRLCLATRDRLDATVWTADTQWGASEQVRQIR